MYATGSREHGLGAEHGERGPDARGGLPLRPHRPASSCPNTLRLLEWARANDMRRVFLTYGSEVEDYSDLSPQMYDLCKATRNRKGLREHELLDVLDVRPTERVINKITPSAFTSSPIELILRTYGATDLLFTGVSTNMCVESTLRDASDKGFGCVLVEDATGTDAQEYHDNAILTLQRLYASVMVDRRRRSRVSTRASRRDRPPSAEGRGRRRWHVHRPHARRRRVGLGGRAQDREHPERSVAGDDGRPARALRARRRGARGRRAAAARDDRRDEHRPRAQRLDDGDDHDPRVPGHHLHRSPPAAEDVLDLPGPPVARADAGRAAQPPRRLRARRPARRRRDPARRGRGARGRRARCARPRSRRSPSASCSRS